MKDSIRLKEHQYRVGRISKQEYVDWMKSNHSHLTIGDWCVLAEAEVKDIKLEDNANELDAKRCEMAAMSAKLEDFKKGYQDDKEVIQRLREQVKKGREQLAERDAEKSMYAHLVQRNSNLIDIIDELKEQLEVEKGAAYLDTPVPGSWIVIHTSVNYAPCITVVPEDEFEDYFANDNGWEECDITAAREMESGSHRYFDMGNAISIVRV